ncbi:hypothetical protein HMPREF1573_01007 [Gardnerella vaginalis JCP7276]|nr:hypothetical protein HMPREF1575_00971 [Gardnerella vaginalis JCP7672]EPI56170.1 hypothetical protein HMPREF1573_01007 [Gardnerella vaginalis JCP7276]
MRKITFALCAIGDLCHKFRRFCKNLSNFKPLYAGLRVILDVIES